MTHCGLDSSVVDWIIDNPMTMRLFDELDIDYSCGGKSLAYACRQRGLDPPTVLEKLKLLATVEGGESQATSN